MAKKGMFDKTGAHKGKSRERNTTKVKLPTRLRQAATTVLGNHFQHGKHEAEIRLTLTDLDCGKTFERVFHTVDKAAESLMHDLSNFWRDVSGNRRVSLKDVAVYTA